MFDKYHLTTINAINDHDKHECVFQLFIRNIETYYLPPDYGVKTQDLIQQVYEFYLTHFGSNDINFIKDIKIANIEVKDIIPVTQHYPIVEIVTQGLKGLIFESALINRTQLDLIYTTRLYKIKQLCDEIGIDVVADFALRRAPSIEAANRFSEIAMQLGYKSSNMNLFTKYPTEIIGTYPHAFVQYMTVKQLHHMTETYEFSLISEEQMMWSELIWKDPKTVVLPDTYDWREVLLYLLQNHSEFRVRVDSDHEEMLKFLINKSKEHKCKVGVIVSGDMNEDRIKEMKSLLSVKHPYFKVVGLAVGTQVANNIKPLSIVYKLVSVDSKPVVKKASGKSQIPGRKHA